MAIGLRTLRHSALVATTVFLSSCGGGNEPPNAVLQAPTAQAGLVRPAMQASRITGSVATAVHVFQALYGQAPSYDQLLAYTTQAANGPAFATSLVSSFAHTSDTSLALLVLNNLGITASTVPAVNTLGQSEYALLLDALGQLFAAYGPAARGQIIFNATNLLVDLESDATYGGAAITYNNQALANYSYGTSPTSISAAVVPVVTANAGTAQSVLPSASVTLDASASTAAPGKSLSYSWTLSSKPSGSSAVLANASAAKPSFTVDLVGTYVASVVVSDGTVSSSPASVRIASAQVHDTGVTAGQCYGAGSDSLVSCTGAAALALNSAQDGMIGRDLSSPSSTDGSLGFSFSAVDSYASTECVKDNLTGLVWEGKTTSGTRANTNSYSNYGDSRTGDASSYVVTINAASLCGFTDWRLPTRDELQGLVDYSVANPSPTLDATWFPNAVVGFYWTASPYLGSSSKAWYVSFANGYVSSNARSGKLQVRLVR